MPEKLNLAGKQFGRLTVLKEVGKNKHGHYLWLCRCECGREKVIVGSQLVKSKGGTRGCGHHHKRSGPRDTRPHICRIKSIWRGMLECCENLSNVNYHNYGARGITVCPEWHDINKFYAWAINNGYQEHLIVNRIDNGGNYEPSNCNWATWKEVAISHNGESHTV